MNGNKRFPCPACGFLVFEETLGSYDICPLCGWEDDYVQLMFPTSAVGANKKCLADWQADALRMFPLGFAETSGFIRDRNWRPLATDKIADADAPHDGKEYFEAAKGDSPGYYWLK